MALRYYLHKVTLIKPLIRTEQRLMERQTTSKVFGRIDSSPWHARHCWSSFLLSVITIYVRRFSAASTVLTLLAFSLHYHDSNDYHEQLLGLHLEYRSLEGALHPDDDEIDSTVGPAVFLRVAMTALPVLYSS
ncbi:hypothetical protein KP509_1Z027300 [Ceratopteris richardii]|nr:hypothetical protein KP509_1Z027300 [Ceratopteris richardii]